MNDSTMAETLAWCRVTWFAGSGICNGPAAIRGSFTQSSSTLIPDTPNDSVTFHNNSQRSPQNPGAHPKRYLEITIILSLISIRKGNIDLTFFNGNQRKILVSVPLT